MIAGPTKVPVADVLIIVGGGIGGVICAPLARVQLHGEGTVDARDGAMHRSSVRSVLASEIPQEYARRKNHTSQIE